jgi:hypothetical protein
MLSYTTSGIIEIRVKPLRNPEVGDSIVDKVESSALEGPKPVRKDSTTGSVPSESMEISDGLVAHIS